MERQKAKAVLEAILFTMGESVEVERLASVIEEDKKTTRELLKVWNDINGIGGFLSDVYQGRYV